MRGAAATGLHVFGPHPAIARPDLAVTGEPSYPAGPVGYVAGPMGHVIGPTGQVIGPTGQVIGPTGQVTGPMGQVTGPTGQDTCPTGQVTGPMGQVTGPTGQDTCPSGQVTGPLGQVTRPVGHVIGPTGRVAGPMGHIACSLRRVTDPVDHVAGPMGPVMDAPSRVAGLTGQFGEADHLAPSSGPANPQARRADSIEPGAQAPGNSPTPTGSSPERATAGSRGAPLPPLRGSEGCGVSTFLGLTPQASCCRPFGPGDIDLSDILSGPELEEAKATTATSIMETVP